MNRQVFQEYFKKFQLLNNKKYQLIYDFTFVSFVRKRKRKKKKEKKRKAK